MGAIISAVFGFIELMLGLRFFFRLLGADPTNMFVSWVYHISAPLIAPFVGIFGQSTTTGAVVMAGIFELSTLIALVVYAVIAGIVLQLLFHHH